MGVIDVVVDLLFDETDFARLTVWVFIDQRDPEDVERLFSAVGVPEIFVNNAGVDSTGQEVADMSLETNLYGPFYCSQRFIRARRAAGGKGKIINVTSVHETIPRAAPMVGPMESPASSTLTIFAVTSA